MRRGGSKGAGRRGGNSAARAQQARPSQLIDDSLLAFLQSTLQEMEAAAGGALGEERAKLAELEAALGGLGVGPTSKPADLNDELALASQLDSLEAQLAQVEQQIATADSGTKQLLSQAVAQGAAIATTTSGSEAEAEGGGDGGPDDPPSAAAAAAVDPLASGLLPLPEEVAEAVEEAAEEAEAEAKEGGVVAATAAAGDGSAAVPASSSES